MRIAVASCWKYRDCWRPFFTLFNKFWPDCPYKVWLLTDHYQIDDHLEDRHIFVHESPSWCAILKAFCEQYGDEPILLMQDDFLLTAPPHIDLIEEGAELIKNDESIGCVRLYPCPGADYRIGTHHYGPVNRGTPFRTSTQAAWWNPKYLRDIANASTTIQQFELRGSVYACALPENVVSWVRAIEPWPLEYICTGIVKGKWTRAALALCKEHGIAVDTSLRPIEP